MLGVYYVVAYAGTEVSPVSSAGAPNEVAATPPRSASQVWNTLDAPDAKVGDTFILNTVGVTGTTPIVSSLSNAKDVEAKHQCFYYIEDVDTQGKKNRSAIIEVLVPLPSPKEFALLQNFPNPFNPETWIPYLLFVDTIVTIKIYNPMGQLIKTLDLGNKEAGSYLSKDSAAYWDGKNGVGEQAATGLYFYAIDAGKFKAVKRMLILK